MPCWFYSLPCYTRPASALAYGAVASSGDQEQPLRRPRPRPIGVRAPTSAVWPSADPQADLAAIAAALTDKPRVVVTELNDTYLHAEASSALFGFVDDLELLATDDAIQARSISRLGESDLGVNSARLNLLEPLVHPM